MDSFEQGHRVTARLSATYNLSGEDRSIQNIDYLCVYEFRHNGITYKYRTRQRDNFSPIPEEIELYFKDDPEKAMPVGKKPAPNPERKSPLPRYLFTFGCILLCTLIFYCIYRGLATMAKDGANPLVIIILAVIIFLFARKRTAKQSPKVKEAMIEEAVANGRTATAHLVKYKFLGNKNLDVRYKGKYAYTFKGKTYKYTLYTATTPPKSVRVFFHKNPRSVFFHK